MSESFRHLQTRQDIDQTLRPGVVDITSSRHAANVTILDENGVAKSPF